MRHLAGGSDYGNTCPRVYDSEDGRIIVQGTLIEDREVTDLTFPDKHERVVSIPLELFREAAARLAAPAGA